MTLGPWTVNEGLTAMGAHTKTMATTPGDTWHEGDGWWARTTALPIPDLNIAAVHAGPVAPDALRAVHAALDGTPAMLIVEDADAIADQLTTTGYAVVAEMPLMICASAVVPPVAPDLQVRAARTPQELSLAVELTAEAFSLAVDDLRGFFDPRVTEPTFATQVWLAWKAGEAIGTGISCVTDRADVGVYSMATPPRHERQGAGRSILSAIHRYAAERGAETLMLGATPAGLPLYERTGYTTIGHASVAVDTTTAASTQFPGH